MFREFAVSSATLFALDMIYISLINKSFRSQIFAVQKSPMTVNYLGAAFTYILLFIGLYYFIIKNHRSVIDAFLLGVFVYGVYDFTNLATLREWSVELAAIDMIWGGVLFSLTTFVTYKLLAIIK